METEKRQSQISVPLFIVFVLLMVACVLAAIYEWVPRLVAIGALMLVTKSVRSIWRQEADEHEHFRRHQSVSWLTESTRSGKQRREN